MKKTLRYAIIAFLLFVLFHNTTHLVYAAKETPTVKVAMSEDESIIVERILYTALKQIGYQMATKTAGMRTMVNDVNYGDATIVPAQTIGLDEEYTNLVRIPVPISYVETHSYTRSADTYNFKKWSDLEGLRLSHCWKNLYITKNVPQANASKVITLNDYEDLWTSLLEKETDVAVIPNLTGYVRIVPEGVKLAGIIKREPRYTYVNKNYPELIELLTNAYQQMTDDGTMDLIHNSKQTSDKQTVLHISSYSIQYEWEKTLTEAVRMGLSSNENIEYQNINLNSRQVLNQANMSAVITNTIRNNYIERNPDVIVVSDNVALDFLLKNYFMLFPKTPVVFCGINDFDSSILHGFEQYITGVTESISSQETIDEMLRLYPQTKSIYVLNDFTEGAGKTWRAKLQEITEKNNYPVKFIFNDNKPLSDILNEIKNLDKNTLVLQGTYTTDSNNVFYSATEIESFVSNASKMPVFSLIQEFIGNGNLGGKVSSAKSQGEAAAAMALRILEGTSVSKMPIITDSEPLNHWVFDYQVAGKYAINKSIFPKGHLILNRIEPIWETNPVAFTIALAISGFFLVIILCLVIFLRLMRRQNARLVEMQRNLHSAEELLQKDNDLRRMIDFMPVSVLIIDTSTYTPEYGNRAFLTTNHLDSFEQTTELELSPIVKKALDSWDNNSAIFTYGSLKDSDSEIFQRITAKKLMFHNKECMILISEDITSHEKEKQMLARAAEKEKEANMLKSSFLANMSHEIRTPMNGIIGMTDLILCEKLPSRIEQYIKDIKVSSESLLGIINDILDLSKISEGKLSIILVDTDLNLLLKNIASMMKFTARAKKLDFIENIQLNAPEYVKVDEVRLNQIVVNLLSNAIKFTRTGHVKLSAKIKDDNILIEITDTGIGIKKEDISMIFQAFEQVDRLKNRAIKGTGLGLSITKNIIDLMNGDIYVESEYEKGTTFYVTIPYIKGNKASIKKYDTELMMLSAPTAKILLVDDIQTNLTVGAGLLRMCNITADVTLSGKDAIEHVKKKDYDIVFMDHMMPEMDGIETMQHIRKLGEKYVKLPIIALTANAMNESKDLLLSAGMDDFLSKPINKTELLSILQKWLPANKLVTGTSENEQPFTYSDVLEEASKIDGLDIDLALERIGNLNDVLEDSIEQVAFSIDSNLKKMDDYLTTNDLHNFAVQAHGMKGSLANIGATNNSVLAAELEIAAKADDTQVCIEKFAVFASVLEGFSYELKSIIKPPAENMKPQGNKETLLNKLGEIIESLNNFEANEALAELTSLSEFSYDDEIDNLLNSAITHTKAFHYDEALVELNKVQETL